MYLPRRVVHKFVKEGGLRIVGGWKLIGGDPNQKRVKMDNSNEQSSSSRPEDSELIGGVDPNPKPVKMDTSNEQSSSTRRKHKKVQPTLINTGAQCFEDIVNLPSFVDHTHFIKDFLKDDPRRLAIFAPRRFGKSTHLDMVRRFLEIDIDETTGEISSSVRGPANERKNYKLFEKTRIINDESSKELVEAHLGRHPVIYLDLKISSPVKSVERAEEHCRQVMHNAYLDHGYLGTSTKLVPDSEMRNAREQKRCIKWCDGDMTAELSDSLQRLTRYLYNHCNGTKVYILVDEFDSMSAKAIHSISGNPDAVERLQDICGVLADLLEPVAKGAFSERHVAGLLFTGVSYVCGMGYSPQFNNVARLKFLDGKTISGVKKSVSTEFEPFCGATRGEVESLIQNLVQNKQLVFFKNKQEFLNDAKELDAKKIFDDVESRYSGYCDINGVHVFCLWSVLQYLETGVARNYRNEIGEIRYLCKIFNIEAISTKILNLVGGLLKLARPGTIEFERMNEIPIEDILDVYKFLNVENESTIDDGNVDVVFNILMDLGYLTYSLGGGNIKLPEVREALMKMIEGVVKIHWKINA